MVNNEKKSMFLVSGVAVLAILLMFFGAAYDFNYLSPEFSSTGEAILTFTHRQDISVSEVSSRSIDSSGVVYLDGSLEEVEEEPTYVCFDLDDGIDVLQAGEVYYYQEGGGESMTYRDNCVDTTYLREYYCDENSEVVQVIYDCSDIDLECYTSTAGTIPYGWCD